MRIILEDYLQKIDQSLKDKTKRDIQLLYVMIAASLFAFSYLLFWDTSLNEFEKTRSEVNDIQANIKTDKIYLQNHPESIILNLKNEIRILNAKKEQVIKNNEYIKSQIEAISFLIYDERTWGEYLDSITTNNQKFKLTLKNFTNKYPKQDQAFGHILDISVQSTGGFTNTLNFINALEQSELVVDLHNFALEMQEDGLYSDLNLSVWGITY